MDEQTRSKMNIHKQGVKLLSMSVAQILKELPTFSLKEIETLEHSLRLQKLQRAGKIASPDEARLLAQINVPMPQTGRFLELRTKLQNEALSDDERSELLQISDAREEANAARAEAVMQLATLRKTPFSQLWHQMVGAPQGARFLVP